MSRLLIKHNPMRRLIRFLLFLTGPTAARTTQFPKMRTAARFRNGICLLHDPVNRLAVDSQDLHGLHPGVHLLERQQLAGDAPAPQDQQLVGAFIFSLSLRERSSSRQNRELSEERATAVANLYARNRDHSVSRILAPTA